MRGKEKKIWVLLLLLVAGMLVGSVIWHVASPILPAALQHSLPVGTGAPWTLDLGFLSLTLGIVLQVNLGSALGLLVAILIYVL